MRGRCRGLVVGWIPGYPVAMSREHESHPRQAGFESAIMDRLLQPARGNLPLEAARAVLQFRFRPRDLRRMCALAEKARRGSLSERQREEIESYERVGHLLALLQSKARRSLRKRPAS